jgi:CRP/FNR family transcriptional regulator
MRAVDAAAIIGSCRLFAGLSAARRADLTAIAQVATHAGGTILLRQGEPVPGIFVVGSGRVRVFKTSPAGKEHVLHLAGPGSSIAEVAVIEDIPCPAYAEVIERSVVALLPTAEIQRRLADDADFSRELLPGLAAWVRHFVDLLEDIVLRDAAGRLAHHLLGLPEEGGAVVLPRSRRQLALHLNLTPETVSHVLRRFADGGLTANDGPALRLVDRGGLRAVAAGCFPRL